MEHVLTICVCLACPVRYCQCRSKLVINIRATYMDGRVQALHQTFDAPEVLDNHLGGDDCLGIFDEGRVVADGDLAEKALVKI